MHAGRRRDAASRSIWTRRFDTDSTLVRAAAAFPALANACVCYPNEAPAQESNPFRRADCAKPAHIPALMTSLAQGGSSERLRDIFPRILTNGLLSSRRLRRIGAKLASRGFARFSFANILHINVPISQCVIKKKKKKTKNCLSFTCFLLVKLHLKHISCSRSGALAAQIASELQFLRNPLPVT